MCSLILCYLIINPSCDSTQNILINIQNKCQLDTILNQYVDEGYFPFLFARLEDKNGRVLYEHCRINRNLIPKEVINEQTWIRIWSMSKIITITIVMEIGCCCCWFYWRFLVFLCFNLFLESVGPFCPRSSSYPCNRCRCLLTKNLQNSGPRICCSVLTMLRAQRRR